MVDIVEMLSLRESELAKHEKVKRYLRGQHDTPYAQPDARQEFRWLLQRSKVNMMPLVIDAIAQSLYVDGYQPADASDPSPGWQDWQVNRMDARQTGVHRPALQYGASYVHVVPGNPAPVWIPRTPLKCTTAYENAAVDEFPVAALVEVHTDEQAAEYELITADRVERWRKGAHASQAEKVSESETLTPGMVPIVRFLNSYDPDGDVTGEISPLIDLQDQINMTTFGLLMAQQFSAFRQKWATGLDIPRDDNGRPVEPYKVAVTRMFTAEDSDTRFGQFDQTDLSGYLQSRESTLRAAATIAQVPPHHMLGNMVNLSAEAIVAAAEQRDAKVRERKTLFGESWEQVFRLSASLRGDQAGASDTLSQVRWRDTESRSLSQTADALGKLAQMLGVPVEMLWERIPGWTPQDVERAKELRTSGDVFGGFEELLGRQVT